MGVNHDGALVEPPGPDEVLGIYGTHARQLYHGRSRMHRREYAAASSRAGVDRFGCVGRPLIIGPFGRGRSILQTASNRPIIYVRSPLRLLDNYGKAAIFQKSFELYKMFLIFTSQTNA